MREAGGGGRTVPMGPFRFGNSALERARVSVAAPKRLSRESPRKRFQPGIYRSSGTDEHRRNPAKDLENDPPSRAVTVPWHGKRDNECRDF